MNSSLTYLVYFTLYTIVLLFFGKGGFKRTQNIRDFFVAVSSLGLLLSMATFTATWFSAASMLGVSGSIYADGYNTVLYAIVPWFTGATLMVFLATRLKNYDVVTVPEYFYLRYGSKFLQAMGGLVIVITYVLYIIIQIRGFGIVVSQFLDIDYTFATILIYLFIMYTTFGGLFSVARTDGLNTFLIITGAAVAAVLVLTQVGGITLMHEQASAISSRPFPGYSHVTKEGALLHPFSMGIYPPLLTFTSFFGWGLGLATNPQYAIRIASAKDTKTAVKMICYSVFLLAFVYLCMMVIGIGGRVLQPEIAGIHSVDEVFPYLINHVIYSRYSGLIFISIIAAAISTANSQLLVAASGFTYDIYRNLINPDISDEKMLTMSRVFIFVAGTASLLLSLNPPESLLIYGGYIWGVFTVTFLLPLYGGLLWKRASASAALFSFLAGLTVMAVFTVYSIETGFSLHHRIHPAFPGFLTALLVFLLVSFVEPNKASE